jgi:hypothetical protein
MELLLLGWVLGASAGILHHYFVVKPKLESVIAELRRIAAELDGTSNTREGG